MEMKTMEHTSENLREAAFRIMAEAGNPAKRTNTGQQILVAMADGTTANLKTAAKGGLMVKTMTPANDAEIVGFNANVSHILAAVCLPGEDTVTAYLVPLDVVEAAYRRNNREWTEQSPGRSSTTWVLKFNKAKGDYFGNNMAAEWDEYRVGTTSLAKADNAPKTVLERARSEIAEAYGVETGQVRISVDL
jgi:hypothetical protein